MWRREEKIPQVSEKRTQKYTFTETNNGGFERQYLEYDAGRYELA